MVPIKIRKTGLREGYLPRIKVGDDRVFIGKALVTNEKGSCRVMAINDNEYEATFNIYPHEILDFEQPILEDKGSIITDPEERIQKITETLKLDHLRTPEEREQILGIIKDYPQLFLLEGDKLPFCNQAAHTITSTDDVPLNTKQFRIPPQHRKFIQE